MLNPRWMGLILILLAGCGESPAEVVEEAVLGTIIPWGQSEADVQVVSNESMVKVSVATYGDGCYRMGETTVNRDGSRIEIVPVDRRSTVRGQACEDILRHFAHEVEVRLDAPRPWTIEVRGRRVPPGDTITVTQVVE